MITQANVDQALNEALEAGYNVLCVSAKTNALDLQDYIPWPDEVDMHEVNALTVSELSDMVQNWIDRRG